MMPPMRGTCPICGHLVPIFNYVAGPTESGYLTRHSLSGLVGGKEAVPEKCPGSFGYWVERTLGA